MFGRATITLGICPHSSVEYYYKATKHVWCLCIVQSRLTKEYLDSLISDLRREFYENNYGNK